jgi:endonuclease YncB( thermonuclease family)
MAKTKRRTGKWAGAAIAIAMTLGTASALAGTQPKTKVIFNGKSAPVFFNDGDSFSVLGGTYTGAKARLFGYNTLESHGPVHQWGTWTTKELFTMAKMATMFARKGVWTCDSEGKTDTYGRMLTWCPDLAEEMVRQGWAHAMSVDDTPAKPELIEAQKEAIANKRGLWAHGVPEFVLTSLHSVEEDVDGTGTYNRLVSTEDGHSVKWRHTDRYTECDRVCHMVYEVDETKLGEFIAALKQDGTAQKIIGSLSDDEVASMAREYMAHRHVNRTVKPDDREKLAEHLDRNYVKQGAFGNPKKREDSCMVHVLFERRYGEGRAACLK